MRHIIRFIFVEMEVFTELLEWIYFFMRIQNDCRPWAERHGVHRPCPRGRWQHLRGGG